MLSSQVSADDPLFVLRRGQARLEIAALIEIEDCPFRQTRLQLAS